MHVRSIASRALPPLATVALLAAMHAQSGTESDDAGVEAYHRAAREAIEAVPGRIGPWEGRDVAVPQSAVTLLKPNALLGRRYVNADTGRAVTLVIVQCRDTRDMSGHYPPVCYPAHGWTEAADAAEVELPMGAGTVRATRYAYARSEFDRVSRIMIYDFFVVPGVGVVRDMEGVRRAAADYRRRRLGAAQVQILADASLPASVRRRLAGEIIGPLAPVVEVLTNAPDAGESP